MPSVNNELMNRGIRHAVFMEQLATGEVDRMVRFMDKTMWPEVKRILDARLSSVADGGVGRGAWTTKRYREMLALLDGEIKGSMRLMSEEAAKRLTRIGLTEAQWARTVLNDSVPLDIDWNAPNLTTIRGIVNSRPFQGRFLKKWYTGLEDVTKTAVRDQVNIGLATGESVPRITSRIMGVKGIEKGFSGTSTRAALRRKVRSVVRTSTNHVAAQAREATYAANDDIIKAVRWVSTLDNRTSDICMTLDGEQWPPGQGQRPPAHHQCRSTTVPITKSWKELGVKNAKDVRVGGRIFRNVQTGLNGHAPTRITYPEWLADQPASVQNEILGPRRAGLFRDGSVKFEKFFNDGRRITLKRLAELEGLEPLAAEVEVGKVPALPSSVSTIST